MIEKKFAALLKHLRLKFDHCRYCGGGGKEYSPYDSGEPEDCDKCHGVGQRLVTDHES